mgnify:CR=1 FL=1
MRHLIEEYGDVVLCIAGFTVLAALLGVLFAAGASIASSLLDSIFYK